MFVENLHEYVKTDIKIIAKIQDPSRSEQAQELKKLLETILTNYDTARRLPVGSKPPKR